MTQQCSHTHRVAVTGYTYEFKTRDSPGDESTGKCSAEEADPSRVLFKALRTGFFFQDASKWWALFLKFNGFWLFLMKYIGFNSFFLYSVVKR